MSNQSTPLSKEQQEYLNQQLERGSAFEEMVRSKGWELILAYYQNKVQKLSNDMLILDEADITTFELQRREIIGIKKLLKDVDSSIKTLRDDREQNK